MYCPSYQEMEICLSFCDSLSKRYAKHSRGLDYDDFLGEAGLGLTLALHAFDQKKSSEFTKFAWFKIEFALLDLMRRTYGNRNEDEQKRLSRSKLSLDSLGDLVDEHANSDFERVIGMLDFKKKLSGLRRKERDVLTLLFWADYTPSDIVKVTGIDVTKIHQLRIRTLKKLKKRLEES